MSTQAILAEVPLFSRLDDLERNALSAMLRPRIFRAGERIFSAGDRGEALYIIRSGKVRLELTTNEGECLLLDEIDAGEVVGEISFLDAGPRTASAIAAEDSELLEFERGQLLAFVQHHPHAALDLLGVMANRMRSTDQLLRTRVSRNLNEEEEESLTFGERLADRVAAFGGSWTFIILFGVTLVLWVAGNSIMLARHPFDPYPFIFLNLILSMLAAIQAPVIMMSQNRQGSKDRMKTDMDYRLDLKAELEIAHLHTKVDQIYEILQSRFPSLECQYIREHKP
jgi:CRP/FNR family transcriptional regulator, cyclic AMP receptor protein